MKQLFIIDDDAVSVLILKKMLINANFLETPQICYNGKDALDYFNNNYSINNYYYVFLDINMPIMSGWKFLKEIESFVKSENFFVYLLSSSTNESDIVKAKKYNCIKKFISKPIAKNILTEIVEEYYDKEANKI